MPNLTLLDIAKLTGSRKEVGLIESVATAAPEIMTFPARTVKGTSFMTVDRNKLPATGFRYANEGIVPGKSEFTNRLVQCHIFSGVVEADQAVADAHEDGAADYQAIEAAGVMRSAAIEIGKQVYYGTGEDEKGFPGLQSIWEGFEPLTDIGFDATGTEANKASSVYAVKFGPEFVQMVYGGGRGLNLGPFREETATDANGGKFNAYIAHLMSWVGLQCVHPFAVGRIYNLTEQSGKGLTDVTIAELLAKFPVGFEPDMLIMNRRSRLQLQRSRSVALQGGGVGNANGGSATLAPVPTESMGISILTTDSIVSTEPIVA